MSLNKQDVWADLLYTLDELEGPQRDFRVHLTDAASRDEESEDELIDDLLAIAVATGAYSKAQSRANTRNAHEAIEKGLKAILIEGGAVGEESSFSGARATRALGGCSEAQPDGIWRPGAMLRLHHPVSGKRHDHPAQHQHP